MLLLLVMGLLLGSLLVLYVKKNRESLLLAGMCLSLTLFLLGIMIFIAKKSGISQDLERFLFFSRDIRIWIQYRFLTLGQLGYLIAIGRHLYPLCLLEMAMQYSMISALWRSPLLRRLALVLPAVSLVLYWPALYRWLVDQGDWVRSGLYSFSYLWVVGYVCLALFLLGYEFFSITMSFSRRRFAQIAVCLTALSLLYLLYCGQDPGQVRAAGPLHGSVPRYAKAGCPLAAAQKANFPLRHHCMASQIFIQLQSSGVPPSPARPRRVAPEAGR